MRTSKRSKSKMPVDFLNEDLYRASRPALIVPFRLGRPRKSVRNICVGAAQVHDHVSISSERHTMKYATRLAVLLVEILIIGNYAPVVR